MSVSEVRTVIDGLLRNRAGNALLGLVKKLLDQSQEDPKTLEANLEKIRVSVALFVDEPLAKEVHRRARAAAGL